MTRTSLGFAIALGILAAAATPARAEDAGGKISGAFTDAYEGLRDGMLGAYETSTKGAVEKWNDVTGGTAPAAHSPSADLTVEVQRELTTAGYQPGPVDGRYGPMTGNAIRAYQHDNSLAQDGQISPALLDAMQRKRAAAQ